MNDALLKGGDICQCHRLPTRGVNCERLGMGGEAESLRPEAGETVQDAQELNKVEGQVCSVSSR